MDPEKKEVAARQAEPEIVKFSENSASSINLGLVFIYLSAVLSMAGTFYFWSSGKSIATRVEEKEREKNQIIAEITSPTYKEIEQQASDFKSAIETLQSAEKSRYSMVTFLPEFYKRINKDVSVTSIAVASDGSLSIAGSTVSYRAAADQLLALSNWEPLSDVQLSAVSLSIDSSGNVSVPLAIKAKLDKTKSLIQPVETAIEDTSLETTTGSEVDGATDSASAILGDPEVSTSTSTGGNR